MKLVQSQFEDSILGAEQEMDFTIDSSSSIIFDILRDKMYSDKIGSICREVISNSRDANREAGNGHLPVEIEIVDPNKDQLLFISDLSISFNDRGPGITPDRMFNVFVKYAASTKRDTNSQTGGFGLGAKTPFAYTDTFTVITVCDHEDQRMEYIYTAMIDSSRKGKMVLFDSYPVNKNTGTRIIIPIKAADRHEFETKAVKSTCLWGDSIKYINFDYEIQSLQTIENNDRYSIHHDPERILSQISSGYILAIDGVPYPINRDEAEIYDRGLGNNYVIEIKADVGQLNISANREAVQYNEYTIEFIKDIHREISQIATQIMSEFIIKAPTFLDACLRKMNIKNTDNKMITSNDPITILLINAAQTQGSIVQTVVDSFNTRKSIFYQGKQLMEKIELTHHDYMDVYIEYDGKWTYGDKSSRKKITPELLDKGMIFFDTRKDARRNITIIEQHDTRSFVAIVPNYDISNPTVQQSDELHKLINEYGLNITPYSDYEKCSDQNTLAQAKRYTKKDLLDISAKKIIVGEKGHLTTYERVLKYDRKAHSTDIPDNVKLIAVDSLMNSKIYFGGEKLHQISVICALNPTIEFWLINQRSNGVYMDGKVIDNIKELYEMNINQFHNKLCEINLQSEMMDNVCRTPYRHLMKHVPYALPKSLQSYLSKFPDIVDLKKQSISIYWNGRQGKFASKYDIKGLKKVIEKQINTKYPMLMTFLDDTYYMENMSTKKVQILKDYINIMDKVNGN